MLTVSFLHKHHDWTPLIDRETYKGEIPFGFESWLVYTIVLIAKMVIVFGAFYKDLDYYLVSTSYNPTIYLGSNTFILIISFTTVIFYFFVKCGSVSDRPLFDVFRRKFCLEVLLDVLDSLDLITFVFSSEVRANLWPGIEVITIVLFMIPFGLPVIQLGILRNGNWGYSSKCEALMRSLYLLATIFLVQVPFFIVRIYVWSTTGATAPVHISPFLLKNFIFAYSAFAELVPRMYRPTVHSEQ